MKNSARDIHNWVQEQINPKPQLPALIHFIQLMAQNGRSNMPEQKPEIEVPEKPMAQPGTIKSPTFTQGFDPFTLE